MKKTAIYLSVLLFIALCFAQCNMKKKSLKVAIEPSLKIVNNQGTDDFSLVLNDMDISEDSENTIYRHKYLIVNPREDKIDIDSTDWVNVNRSFYETHEEDLGMEILYRIKGKLDNKAKPFGFDWAVGNEEYGEWVKDKKTGNSTWQYRPGSFFLAYMIFSRPHYYSDYSRYSRGYRGNMAYRGANNQYGTKSTYQKANRKSFYKRSASNKVMSTRKSRLKSKSTSRYKGASSTRRRSGGFGK
ncbi:MAG: hypothetical protein V3V14_04295 [Saprospiraceae bacterium]